VKLVPIVLPARRVGSDVGFRGLGKGKWPPLVDDGLRIGLTWRRDLRNRAAEKLQALGPRRLDGLHQRDVRKPASADVATLGTDHDPQRPEASGRR